MVNVNFESLITKAKQLPAIKTAVVHPVTQEAIEGLIEAAKNKLIVPVLVGPIHKIKQAAQQAKVDLSSYEIIATEHSHAAAEQAVTLARMGKIDMLMKGSLHTDELMQAVVEKEKGLRTARRMSHIFVIETVTYNKLLLLTDCALNIWPDLMNKRDIVQNAIDLAQAMEIDVPKVAVLSAIETINDKLKSTLDAAALCKMADRRQIIGGVLDGPLGFDNAISEEAARLKNIISPVAGKADILLVPDLESGTMLAKQMQYLAKAKLAGIVVGGRIPIVLTSRADHAEARLISCALGQLYSQYLHQNKTACNPLY
jgi:phosphotransacetylase